MGLIEIVDFVSGEAGNCLTEEERNTLIRMLMRFRSSAADTDALIAECKELLA